MATLKDFAQEYAAQLREAGSHLVKAASANAAPSQFVDTVDVVISSLDSLQNSDGTALTPEQIRQACRFIDDELGLEEDTFWQVKKGSVQRQIEYQRQVLLLFTSIRYR